MIVTQKHLLSLLLVLSLICTTALLFFDYAKKQEAKQEVKQQEEKQVVKQEEKKEPFIETHVLTPSPTIEEKVIELYHPLRCELPTLKDVNLNLEDVVNDKDITLAKHEAFISYLISLHPPALQAELQQLRGHPSVSRAVMGTFRGDFIKISNFIESDLVDSLALVRFGDGEFGLMTGDHIHSTQDRWQWRGLSKLGDILNKSLGSHRGQNYFYGIPSPSTAEHMTHWYLARINQTLDYITYANIWVNSNYPFSNPWILELIKKNSGRIVLICNEAARQNALQLTWAKEIVYYPDEVVNHFENNSEEIITKTQELALRHHKSVFMISAGPLAKVLVHIMFTVNPHNKYIDFGSSLDPIVKKQQTREYMSSSSAYARFVDMSFRTMASCDEQE